MITKDALVQRARDRSEKPGDYWDWVAGMVAGKPGIGITDRKHYNQRQWNALQDAKAKLVQPWE